MYIFVLFGVTAVCLLFGAVEGIVRIWERADRRAHPVQAAAPAKADNIVPLRVPGCLPDREAIGNIYSLSDQFADRFREVVNS